MPPCDPEAAGISASDSPKLPARHLNEVQRFASMLRETVFGLDALPPSVCPNDEAVVSFWFRHRGRPPEDLLRVMGRIAPIRLVGSRPPKPVQPGSSECAAEWFVAATRASFQRIQQGAAAWRPSQRRAAVVGAVVRVTPPVPNERLRVRWTKPEKRLWRSCFTPGTARRTAISSRDSGGISGNSAFSPTATGCCSPEDSRSWGSRQMPWRPLTLLDSPSSGWFGRCRGFAFEDQLLRIWAICEACPRSGYSPRLTQQKMPRRTYSHFRPFQLKDLVAPSAGLPLADRRCSWRLSGRSHPSHRRVG